MAEIYKTALAAIEASIYSGQITRCVRTKRNLETLRIECDDSADGDEAEFWGVGPGDDGADWRVHVAAGAEAPDEPELADPFDAPTYGTSQEILDAVEQIGGLNAMFVLEDPTKEEALAVWERVTRNGLVPSSDFRWGKWGNDWAAAHGLGG